MQTRTLFSYFPFPQVLPRTHESRYPSASGGKLLWDTSKDSVDGFVYGVESGRWRKVI